MGLPAYGETGRWSIDERELIAEYLVEIWPRIAPWEDVHDHRCSVGAAIGAPELDSVNPVGGQEERDPVAAYEAVGNGAGSSGVDVLDQYGTGGRAVALPKLGAVDTVVPGEESDTETGADILRAGAESGGVDVFDQCWTVQRLSGYRGRNGRNQPGG